MVQEYQEQEEVKFNFGLALLKRLDEEFSILEQNISYGNLIAASNMLEIINNEIDAFLTENEQADLKKEFDTLNEKILKNSNLDEINSFVFHNRTISVFVNPAARNEVRPMIIKIDRKLRSLMKDKGLLMPPKEESSLF